MISIKLAKGHRLITVPSTLLFFLSLLNITLTLNTSNQITQVDILLVILFFVILAFVIQFFRDPDRFPEYEEVNSILSPADGMIFEIDSTSEPNITIIRIRMRFWDVHVNYMPIKGELQNQYKKRGLLLPILPGLNKYSKSNNARQTMEFLSDSGFQFKVVQISGILAYRTVSYLKKGDKIAKGQRIGMIRFGSETDIHLPKDSIDQINIEIGQKVKAGQTIIGILK